MKTTQTNGNSKNGIRGSRLRFYNSKNELVGELVVPHRNARWYCNTYTGGEYGKKYKELMKLAEA
jgi:hypothetical protein